MLRLGLVVFNVVLVLAVVAIIVINPARSATLLQRVQVTPSSSPTADVPIDQLASVSIALTVARMTNLPEIAAVANQADSESIQLAIASANNAIVDKPQEVSSAFVSNKDIHTYVTQSGDSLSSVAAKFGVSSDSIAWSNNLSTTANVNAGTSLLIPPVSGIVYTVKSGDTASSLATTYHADQAKIIAYNDAELSGLQVGERIIIPDGTITPAPVYNTYSYGSGFAWGSGAIYGFNGYDVGECTWYVATQITVPANWGNADTWAAGARAAGWHVSSVPSVGAIAQTPAGGFGHVGIVVAINGDQVEIRDMNNYGDGGGYGRVGEGWLPISSFPNYITPP